MKVTITPIVFSTVTKGLLKGMEDLEVGGRVETMQSSALLRTVVYWEESWRPEETCCHLNCRGKPSDNARGKKTLKIVK